MRHGETEWSLSGRHTGLTDIPLTENGRASARLLAPILSRIAFARVFSSPLRRARETSELAGLGERVEIDPDLLEWNYGDYEGLTTNEIHARAPGWVLFTDGCPNGESPAAVGLRVDRVIERLRVLGETVALFAHGHMFRVFTARWIGLRPSAARHFLLDTATIGVLGDDRGTPAVERWNAPVTPEALLAVSPLQRPSGNVGRER